jgi:hypothetical protein
MCLPHPPVARDLRTSDTNNLYDLRKKFRPPRVLAPRVQHHVSLSRFASHRTTTTKASRWSTPTIKTTTKERRVTTPDTDTRRQQQYLWPPLLDDRVPRRGLAGLVAKDNKVHANWHRFVRGETSRRESATRSTSEIADASHTSFCLSSRYLIEYSACSASKRCV